MNAIIFSALTSFFTVGMVMAATPATRLDLAFVLPWIESNIRGNTTRSAQNEISLRTLQQISPALSRGLATNIPGLSDDYSVYQVRLDPVLLKDRTARYELRLSLAPTSYDGVIIRPMLHVGFQLSPNEFQRLAGTLTNIRRTQRATGSSEDLVLIVRTQQTQLKQEILSSLKSPLTRFDFVARTTREDEQHVGY